MFVQHGHFLWCPLNIISVIECDSFYVKNILMTQSGFATDLYHNASLFIEYSEGHS